MTKTSEQERTKSKQIGPLRGLLPFLAPYRRLMLFALAALIITASLSLILPLAVRRVVDGFLNQTDTLLDQYFGASIGIAALLAAFTGLRYYLVTRLGERVVADIRIAVYDRVIGMSPQFYERIMTGEVLSRLTTDTTLILSLIGSSVSIALRNILILIGGLAFMLFTASKLTGLVLLLVPAVVVPILVLGRRLRKLSRINQDKIAESSAEASETLVAAQTVQAYTAEVPSRAKFRGVTEEAFSAAKSRIFTRAMMTVIVIFLVFAGIVGVLWIGANDVRSGAMSAGQLVQFLIYAIMVAGSVAALSEIWGELQRAAGATERLVELLHVTDTIQDPHNAVVPPVRFEGGIVFDNVTFRYPARPETAALDGFSLNITPGETIAIVGPSGAGKSTLFQLIQRFYDPEAGTISLDGTPLENMNRSDFRRAYALVPQDPVIFAASAYENIHFGRPEANKDEVYAAAKAAAAYDFLADLPDGFRTFVGERGVMLSGGQKQRIAIARAILRDAPVLLLDEATSALDAASERAVQEAVEAMSAERTTLIVAHRLATVKRADRIIVLDQGKIVDQGTHDELVAKGGLYAELARLQFTDGQLTAA